MNSLTRCLNRSLAGSFLLMASAAPLMAAQTQTYTFGTLAGYAGQGSFDGTGTNAQFRQPNGTALDAAGNLYVSDSANNTIRKVTSAGAVTTIAGSAGHSGSLNASGLNALFSQPAGLAVDALGNIYVADSGNNTIRKITSGGVVNTFAGSPGVIGSSNGTGTNALFSHPQGVALDSQTNVYVADYGNHTIRKITPLGIVTTFAGSPGNFGSTDASGTNAQFYQPEGIAIDSAQNLYVADTANNTIRKITSAGAVTTIAGRVGVGGNTDGTGTNALFYQPSAVAVDSALNVYVTDYFNNTIRKISAGAVTTIAGLAGSYGSADGVSNSARFWGPVAVSVDASNNVYVADFFNNDIRKVTALGVVTTFAGSSSIGSTDGQSAIARFNTPLGGAIDSMGNLYVADSVNNTIRKISHYGLVTTFAGYPGVAGSVDDVGTNASFFGPQAVAIDGADNLYVADTLNNTIRMITPSGMVSTLAGAPGINNNLDGTGPAALFNQPAGITVDASGNIYVADTGNHTIRLVTSSGVVTTIAGLAGYPASNDGTNNLARFDWPKGLATDGSGNIYVADYLNNTVRKMTSVGTNWVVTTIAGLAGVIGSADGTNNTALFYQPSDVVQGVAGNVYVSDSGNQTVRQLSPVGTNWVVTTMGGSPGTIGSSDGTATNANFFFPSGIALDPAGFVYVTDAGNNTIRSAPLLLINNVVVTPRPSSATITWTTSLPATSQIFYGLTPDLGIASYYSATLQTNQGVLLTGLITNSTYYYQIVSTTPGGTATVTGTFSTAANIIMQSAQAQYTGVWVNDTSGPDRYSPVYKFATTTNADTADAIFRPNILVPALYDISFWYSEGSNRSTAAPIVLTYSGGGQSFQINETLPGGKWTPLANSIPLTAGTNSVVRMLNFTGETSKIVIADAVQWVYTVSQDLPGNGTLPAWYTSFYFGTTNVNSGALGANGQTLLYDFITGLTPIDPSARLGFQLTALKSGGYQALFYPWQSGRTYQLYSTTNLVNPVWTPVSGLTVTQTNNLGMILNTNVVSATATFYRLGVQLQ